MSDDCPTVREAWAVYDRWLKTPQLEFRREAPDLLAASTASAATLVTFDKGLRDLARQVGHDVLLLS